jgi:glutathione S-transferase
MQTLYFSPLACSLATRVTLLEAGLEADFVEVNPHTKLMPDGGDYRAIHPLGLVPALRLDDGAVITENAAILQYLAERSPVELAPRDELGHTRLRQWLSFVGTELHKTVFLPLLGQDVPAGAKEHALSKADARLGFVADRLDGRDYLLERFSVADAYLFTVLNWAQVTPIELQRWPSLTAFSKRMLARSAVARAVAEERELYAREVAAQRRQHPAA